MNINWKNFPVSAEDRESLAHRPIALVHTEQGDTIVSSALVHASEEDIEAAPLTHYALLPADLHDALHKAATYYATEVEKWTEQGRQMKQRIAEEREQVYEDTGLDVADVLPAMTVATGTERPDEEGRHTRGFVLGKGAATQELIGSLLGAAIGGDSGPATVH